MKNTLNLIFELNLSCSKERNFPLSGSAITYFLLIHFSEIMWKFTQNKELRVSSFSVKFMLWILEKVKTICFPLKHTRGGKFLGGFFVCVCL